MAAAGTDARGRARVRLDGLLVERGLAESRAKAQALIMAGAVSVNDQPARKPGEMVAAEATLAVAQAERFVSRGGRKLEHALATFGIEVDGRRCLDAGASTGGFTDCLLQRGAARVFAVDVGHGQLDWRLRNDPRVAVMDRTNVRYLESLPQPVDLCVADLSFISLRLVLDRIAGLADADADLVVLVKPQFEAGRAEVGSGGVVRSPAVHRRVLTELWDWSVAAGLSPRGLTASPVRGPAGNVEFLMWLSRSHGVAEVRDAWVAAALAEAAGVA
ncbi:MAG: TlyA family RNA methyltransferase [Chloroflexota bacterium]